MAEMSVEEALTVLGLSSGADEVAIKKAYRDLSLEHHPDITAGDDEKQCQLNEAYEVALSAVQSGGPLVLRRTVQSLQKLERSLLAEQAARKASETAQTIRKRRISRLQQLKYFSWFMAVIAAATGWIWDAYNLLPPEVMTQSAGRLFGLVALSAGIVGFYFEFLSQKAEGRINSFTERLSSRKVCASILARALAYRDVTRIREEELLNGTDESLGMFPFAVSTKHEEMNLVVQKAVELGLLAPVSQGTALEEESVEYEVNFKPTRYKETASRTDIKPTFSPRENIIAGTVTVVVFGTATAYLAIWRHSWWAILTGVFFVAGITLALEGFESRKNKK